MQDIYKKTCSSQKLRNRDFTATDYANLSSTVEKNIGKNALKNQKGRYKSSYELCETLAPDTSSIKKSKLPSSIRRAPPPRPIKVQSKQAKQAAFKQDIDRQNEYNKVILHYFVSGIQEENFFMSNYERVNQYWISGILSKDVYNYLLGEIYRYESNYNALIDSIFYNNMYIDVEQKRHKIVSAKNWAEIYGIIFKYLNDCSKLVEHYYMECVTPKTEAALKTYCKKEDKCELPCKKINPSCRKSSRSSIFDIFG
jgi:hypothetical protein